MKAEINQSVGEWVSGFPSTIPLFESLKIDYCCGGNRSLKEACCAAGVSVEKVLQLLEQVATSRTPLKEKSWKDSTLGELVNFLLDKHHVYTREQLALLNKLSEKVARVHGSNHPELLEARGLFQQLAAELEHHMLKEEQVAFPYLLALEKSVSGAGDEKLFFPFEVFQSQPQRVLMADHELVGEELKELRLLTHDFNPPEDACVTYRAYYQAFLELEQDLHRHIHLENNVLFPMGAELAKKRSA